MVIKGCYIIQLDKKKDQHNLQSLLIYTWFHERQDRERLHDQQIALILVIERFQVE